MLKAITTSRSWKIARRFLPTIIGLYVIGVFLQSNPVLAKQFKSQILTKLGFSNQETIPQFPDLVEEINNYRQTHNQDLLSSNTTLDSMANVINLSMSQDPHQQTQLSLKQAASIVNYKYSVISYFALISPKAGPFFTLNSWLEQNSTDLLSADFSEIGISTITIELDSAPTLLTVVILAHPSDVKTNSQVFSATTTKNKTGNTTFYTGVELWNEVEKYRKEHGVPEYKQDNTLCTMSSIRLNQLIEKGSLDNHAGFEPLVDQFREDKKISYSNVGENILMGYPTPQEAVDAWDGSPGHQALLRDGSYVFACTSANHGYAVLIAAF